MSSTIVINFTTVILTYILVSLVTFVSWLNFSRNLVEKEYPVRCYYDTINRRESTGVHSAQKLHPMSWRLQPRRQMYVQSARMN